MENKKASLQSQSVPLQNAHNDESAGFNEVINNQHLHRHNSPSQSVRQYGLKIPPSHHQYMPIISPSHPHKQVNSPSHLRALMTLQNQQNAPQHKYPQLIATHSQHFPQYSQDVPEYIKSPYQQKHAGQQLFQNSQPVHAHVPPQNNTQIWLPHQPPVHYHQQQQLLLQNQVQPAQEQSQTKTVAENKPQPVVPPQNPAPTTQVQTPVKEPLEKKKSLGTTSHLRSPAAKRPLEAPVTMQGWLYKQGSEGLMLWKKRWFVLSEYCLFYYKGSEEEKLLGSILLPSYKVSVCIQEDKVNKKYAFKCEHANMRTYILAAESHELMTKWMRVLNMACLLQTNIENDQQSVPSSAPSTTLNNVTPAENDVKGQPQFSQAQSTVQSRIHMRSSSNTTDVSNPSQQDQYNQPLYANAPPKPRRLNDGYSSPSPDMLDKFISNQYHPNQGGKIVVKSPLNIYGTHQDNSFSPRVDYVELQRPKQLYNNTPSVREVNGVVNPNVDRRTPDTYGRSKLEDPNKFRNMTDYEDIYAAQTIYKRPLSPIGYNDVKNITPPIHKSLQTYIPIRITQNEQIPSYGPVQLRKNLNVVPRPHSADFLEYEMQNRPSGKQQTRPKSSLDINRNENDNYFYSEETYAEKMRKSVQYLPKMPSTYSNSPVDMSQQQKTPKKIPGRYSEYTFPLTKSHTQPLHYDSPNLAGSSSNIPENIPNVPVSNLTQPIRSRSVLSDSSLSKELLDLDLRESPREIFHRGEMSPCFVQKPDSIYSDNAKKLDSDQFTRSSSARYIQNDRIVSDRRLISNDRKREESMKRLLEWKQRMLQSPLNRKVQISRPIPNRPDLFTKNHENLYTQRNYFSPAVDSRSYSNLQQYNSYSSDDEASESIINSRDMYSRSMPAKKMWTPMTSKSTTNLADHSDHNKSDLYDPDSSMNENSEPYNYNTRHELSNLNDKKVSAGELLGRTHEELVLLLIQLRRQSANILQAIENYYNEIDTLQAQLNRMDQVKRLENLQKLEQIKQHLMDLERQYEKGKPLVNLVDNMVKLGSLYRYPNDRNNLSPYIRERLEFNQQIQERRLLTEEQREWNRLNPDCFQLQEKVQQLYQLDKLIQKESGTLQSLQRDKEEIERALGGLRHRVNKGFADPIEVEIARKQQIMLENDLSRVHLMLAQNSKKLEETVTGNARLEQELLILKQKLQNARQQRSSPQFSNAGDSLPCVIGTSAMLESDLQRVQQTVGGLQKQRQELSIQVRQLTDRSNTLLSSKNHNAQNQQNLKKRINSLWRETDLDTMNIIDHGNSSNTAPHCSSTPLYINTDIKQSPEDYRNMKSNDYIGNDSQIMQNEKQEIKTVRIVKRESERRQRDREKSTTGKWDSLPEEEDIIYQPSSDMSFKSSTPLTQKTPNVNTPLQPSTSSERSPALSPIFQSEAARQIITEMSFQEPQKQTNRRAVPKEKRRHYTAPNNELILKNLNQLSPNNDAFDKMIASTRRAKDDLDMERALRQRIDAPDVVRSTLGNKELKFNESMIDNILGTPNKINIPERYIPEQLPQLSAEEQEHRLRKVESIKKMLSDTALVSSSTNNLADEKNKETSITSKATTKMIEEKKEREHLLQLNQILAKQVMEMSKIVAGTNIQDEK